MFSDIDGDRYAEESLCEALQAWDEKFNIGKTEKIVVVPGGRPQMETGKEFENMKPGTSGD